jgi:hypothetical protein
VNNRPEALTDAKVKETVYDLDGTVAAENEVAVTAAGSAATTVAMVDIPKSISATYFVKLDLTDAEGKTISSNFYWRNSYDHQDDLTALNTLPLVTLEATVERGEDNKVTVTLHNNAKVVALMAHLQLRHKSGERVLPVFYSDNYVSLVPGESRTMTMEAGTPNSASEDYLVTVDGWNVSVAQASAKGVAIAPNVDAQPGHWPTTGLPFQTVGLR